jgi:hypothetical protein
MDYPLLLFHFYVAGSTSTAGSQRNFTPASIGGGSAADHGDVLDDTPCPPGTQKKAGKKRKTDFSEGDNSTAAKKPRRLFRIKGEYNKSLHIYITPIYSFYDVYI